jgi:drug/metabolite transporter (DMT)-like permease
MIGLLVLLCVSSLALAFTMSKGVLDYANPVWFTTIRMLVAGVLLIGYHVLVQKRSWKIRSQDIFKFIVFGFFHIYCAYIFEFWALETVSAAKDALFFNMTPFITALISLFMLGERLSLKQWGGLALGFVGFLPLLMAQAPAESMVAGGSSFISWPEIYLLIAVTGGSIGWILLQKLIKDHAYEPIFANGVAMVIGGLGALVTALLTEPGIIRLRPDMPWCSEIPYIAWYLFVLIMLTNVICYSLYGWLLKTYSATFMALACATVPIFTALFDWLLFGLTVTWHFVATVVIVFIGLAIFYADEMKKDRTA